MRTCFYALVLAATALVLHRSVGAEESPTIRVVVIGDSTVASYPNPPKDRPDLTGWGQVLGEFFDSDIQVLNHAKSGRSSKSFQKEGLWKKALADKPDYVLVQFGHNDCPGKGDRYTDPKTDFRDYLRTYIDDARNIGAMPILVTPMTRRRFRNGKIQSILRPYADAMIAVGKEKQTPVIDLHKSSVKMFNKLGDAGSADLSPSTTDRTHFSRKGALAIATLVIQQLPQADPQLASHLRNKPKP